MGDRISSFIHKLQERIDEYINLVTRLLISTKMIGEWDWDGLSYVIDINDIYRYSNYPWNMKIVQQRLLPEEELPLVNGKSLYENFVDWLIRTGQYEERASSTSDLIAFPDLDYSPSDIDFDIESVDHVEYLISRDELDNFIWDWYNTSYKIDFNEIITHPYCTWDKGGLSVRHDITVDFIHNFDLPNATGEWNFDDLSECISIKEIRKHPELPWIRSKLSDNIEITIEDVIAWTVDRKVMQIIRSNYQDLILNIFVT